MLERNDLLSRKVYPGQIYLHFKGKKYKVLTLAEHTETGETMVVYMQLYAPYHTYARPIKMFLSEVDHEKYPMVIQKERFHLVDDGEIAERYDWID